MSDREEWALKKARRIVHMIRVRELDPGNKIAVSKYRLSMSAAENLLAVEFEKIARNEARRKDGGK